MRRQTLPLALLALATSVGTLAAQPGQRTAERAPNRGAERAQPRVANRVANRAANPAASLLRLRTQLLLTDAQVAQLTTLSAAAKSDRPEPASESLRLRADLRDARSGSGDPVAVRAALDELSAIRNARIVEGMEARNAALEVLTAEQRTKARRVITRVAQNARSDRQRTDRARPDGRLGRDRGINGDRR